MEYDISENELVSGAVIRIVSSLKGVEPMALEALYETTNPEALDKLATSRHTQPDFDISFEYEDYHVRIQNGDHITAEPIDQNSPSGRSRPT